MNAKRSQLTLCAFYVFLDLVQYEKFMLSFFRFKCFFKEDVFYLIYKCTQING